MLKVHSPTVSFPDPDRVLRVWERVKRSLFIIIIFDLCPELGSRAPGFVWSWIWFSPLKGWLTSKIAWRLFLLIMMSLNATWKRKMDFIKSLWYSLLQNRAKQLLGVKIHDSYKWRSRSRQSVRLQDSGIYSCTASVSNVAWGWGEVICCCFVWVNELMFGSCLGEWNLPTSRHCNFIISSVAPRVLVNWLVKG